MLDHETPLKGYHPKIGGSAGRGTHGGGIDRPEGMPREKDADFVVSSRGDLLESVQVDDAIVYVEGDSGDTIDVSGAHDIRFGSGVQLVGPFCDPGREGRGPVIHQKHYERNLFISKWGEAPTLWGVSLRGPNTQYFDPRERASSDEWDSDDKTDWYASGLWCYDDTELDIIGCEFWGWTMAGLEIGSRGHETPATIRRSTFHHNMMETLGYGVEHYNGDIWIDRCFFDSCRHGYSGFGYPSEFVDITNCVIGPGDDTDGWCGHAIDVHKEDNNLHNGSWRAGGHIRIRNCTSMCTWDLSGYKQEGFALRGTSENLSWEDKNHWYQEEPPDPPGTQGDAFRQEVKQGGWDNFEPRDSVFGAMDPENVPEGYGAPRAEDSTMKLIIEGRDIPANYRLTINGDASTSDQANPGDRVRENDDGTTTISGFVNPYRDSFELSDDAQLLSFRASGPCDLYLDGKKVDLAPLVAAGAWQRPGSIDDEAVTQLRERIEQLAAKLDSIRLVFGGNSK